MHCDLDLWPFNLKIYRAILASWGVCMWSFMMIGVKGKQSCAGNPNAAGRTDGQTDGRTDRRTDGHGDSSIPPPNFVAGGINIPNWIGFHKYCIRNNLKKWKCSSQNRDIFIIFMQHDAYVSFVHSIVQASLSFVASVFVVPRKFNNIY